MIKKIFFISNLLLFLTTIYSNEIINDSIEKKIDSLLQKMTLTEKIKQMDMYDAKDFYKNGKFNWDKFKKEIKHGMGSIHETFIFDDVKIVNKMQKFALKYSTSKIPILVIEEGLHSYINNKSTLFPAPIGLASTWNPELIENIGHIIAKQARSKGAHFILGPVLGIARDPRWGRTEETFGEDPYLVSEMGAAIVKGMQGNDLTANDAVVAEPKHFGAHSQPEAGSNTAPVPAGKREMFSQFFVPFYNAIKKANALGIMAAYHELDGIPCVSNEWLLKDVLKNKWNFQGFVLSDNAAIALQINTHHTAEDPVHALAYAIKAGTDMQFYDFDHETFEKSIKKAIKIGLLTEQDIDNSVRRILRVKFLLGLFSNPITDTHIYKKAYNDPSNKKIAYQSSLESIILLKNENNILPLKEKPKSIAVIGPLANYNAVGGYSPHNAKIITFLQAIKSFSDNNSEILYSNGTLKLATLQNISNEFLKTPDSKHNGLKGEYFDNIYFKGKPVVTTIDTTISNYWGKLSPKKNLPADSFAIRWTGYIVPPISGTYEIGIITDDMGRLYINDSLKINNWKNYKPNLYLTTYIKMEAGKKYKIKYEYADLTDFAGLRLKWRIIDYNEDNPNLEINKAVNLAKKADIIFLVLGETSEEVGENKDKAEIILSKEQLKLARKIKKLNKPTIVVLINGRPLCVNYLYENFPALLEAWFPGEYGGSALVDLIFGKSSPSGKLPITFPKSTGQLPYFYNHKPSSLHRYIDIGSEVLFPFGYGLSYTNFEYSNLKILPQNPTINDTIAIYCTIKNIGNFPAKEVVQLYINDIVSSVTTPIMSLQGFKKVFLNPGEVKEIKFILTKENLGLWNKTMNFVVEPGDFKIMIGSSSQDIKLQKIITLKEK